MKKAAFTLLELMIVVLLLGILMSIAIPGFMSAREHTRRNACIDNLREIHTGKEIYAMENRLAQGDSVSQNDLVPDYIKMLPGCPSGGGPYTIGNVGEIPTCSLSAAPQLHAIP